MLTPLEANDMTSREAVLGQLQAAMARDVAGQRALIEARQGRNGRGLPCPQPS